jgi:hypothetical protein
MNKGLRIIILISLIAGFAASILYTKDIQSWTGFGDMRSRVVAARQVKDGSSPYFVNWYPGDSLRYFTGGYVDTPRNKATELANLTVSPPFLRCLSFVADNDNYKIDLGAYILFHLFFIISVILALYYTHKKRWLITLLLLVPITFTDGWVYHFFVVQHYMLYAFLFTLIVIFLVRKNQLIAGLLMALLFIFRLNTLVFVLPFLLLFRSYKKFLSGLLIGVLAYGIFVCFSPFEQKLWKDYSVVIKRNQAIQMIENVPATSGNLYILPYLPAKFEGSNYYQLDTMLKHRDFKINKESTNFKNVYEIVFKHYPSITALSAMFLLCVLAIVVFQFVQLRKKGNAVMPLQKLIMTGLLFYFLSNFFSTVAIVPYHLPQWWVVALVYAIYADKIPRATLILFLTGILLNQHLMVDFKGRHFIAEAFLLASLLFAVMAKERSGETTDRLKD